MLDESLSKMKQGALDPLKQDLAAEGLHTYFQLVLVARSINANEAAQGSPFYKEKLPGAVKNLCDVADNKAYLMTVAQVDSDSMRADLEELNHTTKLEQVVAPFSNTLGIHEGNLQFSLGNRVRASTNAMTSTFVLNPTLKVDLTDALEWTLGPATRGVLRRAANQQLSQSAAAAALLAQPPTPIEAPPQGPTINLNVAQPPTAATPGAHGHVAQPAHTGTGGTVAHGHVAKPAHTGTGGTAAPGVTVPAGAIKHA